VTKLVEFQGISASVADHCRRLGLPSNRIYNRLSNGWKIERALSEPILPRGGRRTAAPPAEAVADDDGREFATVAPVAVAKLEPPPPLSRPFVDHTPHPKLDVQPLRTVPVLPRGTVAAVAEAARILRFVEDLIRSGSVSGAASQALRADCRAWRERFANGGAA
jgi:hypothetical protein